MNNTELWAITWILKTVQVFSLYIPLYNLELEVLYGGLDNREMESRPITNLAEIFSARFSVTHLDDFCNISCTYFSTRYSDDVYCTWLPGCHVFWPLIMTSGCRLLDYLPPRMNLFLASSGAHGIIISFCLFVCLSVYSYVFLSVCVSVCHKLV